MRTTTIIAALVALASAISALPVPQQLKAEGRDVETLEGRKKHSTNRIMTAPRITFYGGSQLNNPACGGPTPNDNSMIAAVKNGGAFQCGDRIHIQHGGRSVQVKVVDYCAGCSPHSIDLTTGAFLKLASLDTGVVSGAKVWKM